MTLFLVLAAVLAGAAVAFAAWPLLRASSGRVPVAALVVGLVVPLSSAYLYHRLSNYSWDPADRALESGGAPSVPQMLERLERRLADHPDDVAGWSMLGRSNFVLKDYPKAVAAYEKAYALTKGQDGEVDASLAEALAMVDPGSLGGRGAELLDQALKADPKNPRALWFGGVAAYQQGNRALARSRWLAVLDLGPPPAVARALAQQIVTLDAQAGQPADPKLVALAASGGEGPAADQSSTNADTGAGAGAAEGPVAHLTVEISGALKARMAPGGTLFVFAQDPGRPGPPLAVRRFPPGQALPLDVDLGTGDAMMPTRTIASVAHPKIVARYSLSGQPLAARGDLYGEVSYDLAHPKRARVVIDHVVE